MPITDGLTPHLSPAAKEVIKSFGGWTAFLQSYGLKPTDDDDAEEGRLIAERMGQEDERSK
nr:uncharacterized protein CI109_002142 [Kwoniella shandongensis]KAA5529252.1 hypothetical protein CI109_002142 [Kwoniella shandongensis]